MNTTLQLNSYNLASLKPSYNFKHSSYANNNICQIHKPINSFCKMKIRAVGNVPESKSDDKHDTPEEPPSVKFAFVHSVLLPDGTPDIHFRSTCGGQKLREIMLDSNIDLYGPYARPLLNCAGAGTCASCMVEVIMGKELLNPRTETEKEKLKRKPKNWRLACQTTVGNPDSRGLVVIQQLPEWKAHEWKYEKLLSEELLPPEFSK
ncbi:photosynthetic NDH subunit of subcomplex B 3, chloroplastic [Mercurialis annua]|uniref:photosynthetic NDH subunit of subcomplex B 3, chloroplastic n=1 Tax=Mercurialis annua TaxID=3986 RepID=UPI002160D0B3|nr:photosynthetic NDH subunit of subcomplex B 3, chloroplastic [Mercurialis annua]